MKGKRRIIWFLVMFLLLGVTGINYLYAYKQIVIITFIILFLIVLFEKYKFEKRSLLILILFPVIELIQFAATGQTFWPVFFSNILRLSIAYLTITILRQNFFIIYTKIIYFFSIISLFIFFSIFIFPSTYIYWINMTDWKIFHNLFSNPIVDVHPNIIIYTFNPACIEPLRNSGPFWEPGAYAIFVAIALIFNIIINKKIYNKQNLIFIITILTTLSTAGYIALFILFLGYIIVFLKSKYKILYTLITLIIGGYLFSSINFLENKIDENISLSQETTRSRFGSAQADLILISEKPIIGWGRSIEGTYGTNIYDLEKMHRNNGLTKLAANYGIPIFCFYFILLFYNLYWIIKYHKVSTRFVYFAILAIIMLGFSQTIFNRPFFYCMITIVFVLPNYKRNYEQEIS